MEKYGKGLVEHALREHMMRMMNPVVVMPFGYGIVDCRPGTVVEGRPLGQKKRPLAVLAAFEQGMNS